MKPSEKVVLDTLRKTTLAYLSESDYAQIEKAVEQKGILNLTGTASILVKSAVQKHEGGGHDQDSHGSWAGNGAGGKNIQDMSANDQKEFIDRMSSAKSGAEQRAIIDEFKGRQKGGDTSKSPATPLASPAGKTFSHPAQTRSLNSIANEIVSDPNYKGSTKTYAQPYIAAMHQMNDIGDNYYADSGDSVVRYALSNLSTWRGEKARTIKAELKAMLKSLDSPVSKATSVKTGDMVSTLKKKQQQPSTVATTRVPMEHGLTVSTTPMTLRAKMSPSQKTTREKNLKFLMMLRILRVSTQIPITTTRNGWMTWT